MFQWLYKFSRFSVEVPHSDIPHRGDQLPSAFVATSVVFAGLDPVLFNISSAGGVPLTEITIAVDPALNVYVAGVDTMAMCSRHQERTPLDTGDSGLSFPNW